MLRRTPKQLSLTGGLNFDRRLLRLFPGHGIPGVIRVLDPFRGLAVELSLVCGLQLVDGETVGSGAGLVQTQVS